MYIKKVAQYTEKHTHYKAKCSNIKLVRYELYIRMCNVKILNLYKLLAKKKQIIYRNW